MGLLEIQGSKIYSENLAGQIAVLKNRKLKFRMNFYLWDRLNQISLAPGTKAGCTLWIEIRCLLSLKSPGIPIDDLFFQEPTKPDDPEPPTLPLPPVYIRRFSTPQIIITCIILLLIGSTSFVAWENSATSIRLPNPDEKSMYWDGNHYEPVKAGQQNAGTTIIPLNIRTLTHQTKITLPDTLTSYSLGKVWYKGFVKDHEFFTAAGPYPIDTTRVLKKLSPTILAKYISYSRYIQTRLLCLLYATIFVAICGFGASRLKKEVKTGDQLQEANHAFSLSKLVFRFPIHLWQAVKR